MSFNPFPTATLLFLLVSGFAWAEVQADWPSWRGPHDNGSTEVGTYPTHFDENNTRWRVPLPGKGCSTPIVLERTIYLTAPVNGNDAILSIDWSGEQRWSTVFGPEDAGKHRNGSGSNASPVTDGNAVAITWNTDGIIAWAEV